MTTIAGPAAPPTITVSVDGLSVAVSVGASALDAINASGVVISQLCKDADMPAIGACRTCLVQIDGVRGFPASCSVPVTEGMVIHTDTADVRRIRSGVIELTLGMVNGGHPSPPAPLPVGEGSTPLTLVLPRGGTEFVAGGDHPHPDPLPSRERGDVGRDTVPSISGGGDHPDPLLPSRERGDVGRDTVPARRGGVDGYGQLSAAAELHGIVERRWEARERPATDTSNPVFNLAMDACILCARCVNACQSAHQFIGAIDVLGAGETARIATAGDKPLAESICTTCGQCLSVCPTGAISVKEPPAVSAPTHTISTTCPYCGVGCGIQLEVDDATDRIVASHDDPDNLSSVGMLCVKGRFGYTFAQHPDRIKTPLIRDGERFTGPFREATWDEALDLVASRLVEYRGDRFATLCSAKATNEDGYVQQKFSRLVMGSNNIDHCTRLCHSPSVEAMLTSLGSGATSNSYTDYEGAGCLVVIGCDPTSNHPVAASRMRRAIVERGAKLIVINPRRIDMCDYADLWLRAYPGTDVALLNAMAQVIVDEGLAAADFVTNRTEGYDDWLAVANQYTPERAAAITGVAEDDIRAAARIFARPPVPRGADDDGVGYGGSCLIWGMGITQHTNGTANAHGLLNLALVAGQLGRRGSGISPLRGQNNVQGCGDAGCLPNSLPGYQGLRPDTLVRFGDAWGANGRIPDTAGLVVTDMVESMGRPDGVRAMYITGENPLLSEPDLNRADELFRRLEFLVVQDIFMHETAELADVVLPATSFAEKDGTFTNSERRVQRVRQAIPPVGGSRPDWDIVCDLARRMCDKVGLPWAEQFTYGHPSDIFDEMAELTPILSGISYQRLDAEGGIQWPCPSPEHPGTTYLYADDFPRGDRAKFVAFEQGPLAAETPSERFPLVLNTGRVLYHWHGGTITRRVDGLMARSPALEVSINPLDGERFGLQDGGQVQVRSRRGSLTGVARYTYRMRTGEIFVPFVRLADSAANFLTNAAYDPESRIPEYKVCAVRVETVEG